MSTAIRTITGTITTNDGETREFQISSDSYNQWGNSTARLGATVDAVQDILVALDENGHFEEDGS